LPVTVTVREILRGRVQAQSLRHDLLEHARATWREPEPARPSASPSSRPPAIAVWTPSLSGRTTSSP